MSTADVHVRLDTDPRELLRALAAAHRAMDKALAPHQAARDAQRARTRRMKTTYHRRNR
ncbi:hypothetical protein [Microbispora rosea]|uniref:hypothetical protein n=1 Tax=Microbispora rosea TaxID=58117 RepID=UPI003793EC34